jgi:predicted AlkP superfamily phosphohydrolase/phosphomutase
LSSLRDFKKNLEVLYDDVTKAFEIRSNEFKYVLTKKQVHALYREQAASFEKEIKDFIAEVDEEIEELELIELRGQP